MERRYLVATLALVATFSIFSRGFCPVQLSKLPHSRAAVMADLTCAKHYVAGQLMAKLQPYVDRGAPDEAQMVAELNLPELARVEQKVAAPQTSRQKCPFATRTQQAKQQAFELRINPADQTVELNDLAVVRAQDLSERAMEWSRMASDTTQRINMNVILRAQETAARNLELAQQTAARNIERAQRDLEKSRRKMAHSQTQGMPIHINFVVPAAGFAPPAPVTPEPPSAPIL